MDVVRPTRAGRFRTFQLAGGWLSASLRLVSNVAWAAPAWVAVAD